MKSRPNFIVGIGSSIGGLEANIALFSSLGPRAGMAFVLVPHLGVKYQSSTIKILSRHTAMPVMEATEGTEVQKNSVYVIPQNADLFIEQDVFIIRRPRTMIRGRHRQVDLFLKSLAVCRGKSAIGVILSGAGDDGVEGCMEIKRHSGRTYAQDWSAICSSMPLHALTSGSVDFLMNPEEIARDLERLQKPPSPSHFKSHCDEDCETDANPIG